MSGIIEGLVGKDIGSRTENREREVRLTRAKDDFWFFCRTYLPHYFGSKPAPYHEILIEIASSNGLSPIYIEKLHPWMQPKYHAALTPISRFEGIVDVEPRGFSKTTRWALAFPLWCMLFGKKKFGVIFGATQDMANRNLGNIADELENNDLIYNDFGDLKGDEWKSDFIVLSNGTALAAKGSGSSVRGVRYRQHRPDLIICDDIIRDDQAASPTQRDKIYQWFLRAVLPLGKDAVPVVINTIFHDDDVPSRLLKRISSGELPGWIGLRFGAITPDGGSLWPDYWTLEKLEAKRQQIGSMAFNTEYLNEPLSSEDAMFREAWFRYWPQSQNWSGLTRFMGVDPATGAHDQAAILTIGRHPDGFADILDSFGKRMSPDAFIKVLIEKYLIYRPQLIGFETVSFQKVFKDHIMKEAAKQGIYLPIVEMKPGSLSKETRLSKLSTLIENGLIRFGPNQKDLINQLVTFPKGGYDDQIDALYYAMEVAGGGNRGPQVFGFDRFGIMPRAKAVLRGFNR